MDRFRNNRKLILLIIDVVLINLSYILAFYFRFTNDIPQRHLLEYKKNALLITLVYIVILYIFKLYKSLWEYASIDEFILAVGGCVTGSVSCMLVVMANGPRLPYSVSILAGFFSLMFIVGFRVSFRVYRRYVSNIGKLKDPNIQRTMIIGAGDAGNNIIKEMRQHLEMKYQPVVIIDDDRPKIGQTISGLLIYGNRKDIISAAEAYDIETIVIAIPSLDNKNREEIINICKQTNCKLKILPGVYELLDRRSSLRKLRDVDVEDLLGREPVKLDMEGISDYIENRVVLVTGGGGSIGSELARQIAVFKPKSLLILDIYENNAYDLQMEMKHNYPELDLKVIIASVRDKNRIGNVFYDYKPEVVFHAAAHKHVPLMEDNPFEAIKNNVFGTLNVAECAKKYKAKKFVLISTDKAVNPTNVMGATKRICEMIVQSMDKECETEFAAVRFGNVLGSNGSVVPLFKKQISKGGPITLTHKEITRYFMTIPEAAQLVLQAAAFAHGGEIFVLDMGKPVKIYDLAYELIKLSGLQPGIDIDVVTTGLRPGEKLYEEVLLNEEGLTTTSHNKIFIGKPLNINYSVLKRELLTLKDLIDNTDKNELLVKLRKLVPTYVNTAADAVTATKEIS